MSKNAVFDPVSKTITVTCECGHKYAVKAVRGAYGSDLDFCPRCDSPTGERELP